MFNKRVGGFRPSGYLSTPQRLIIIFVGSFGRGQGLNGPWMLNNTLSPAGGSCSSDTVVDLVCTRKLWPFLWRVHSIKLSNQHLSLLFWSYVFLTILYTQECSCIRLPGYNRAEFVSWSLILPHWNQLECCHLFKWKQDLGLQSEFSSGFYFNLYWYCQAMKSDAESQELCSVPTWVACITLQGKSLKESLKNYLAKPLELLQKFHATKMSWSQWDKS